MSILLSGRTEADVTITETIYVELVMLERARNIFSLILTVGSLTGLKLEVLNENY